MAYQEQKFTLPALVGLSEKQIDVHLKLYAGYVKHTNVIIDTIADLEHDAEKNAFTIAELRRRMGFEFNGMRMHEYFFEQFEHGPAMLSEQREKDALTGAMTEHFGSLTKWTEHFKKVGMTRGIGWVITYRDPKTNMLSTAWVGDHELGQLAGLDVIVALDMWEHAFMVDYTPAEKAKYMDSFLQNLNWNVMENRFKLRTL